MRILLIDHYDSFTWNVADWLRRDRCAPAVEIVAYDDVEEIARVLPKAQALVLSPGPKCPDDAAETLALVRQMLGRIPILGVCLGHQMLAHIAGSGTKAAKDPWHGTTRSITPLHQDGLFRGMPSPFAAATYNSLVIEEVAAPWRIDAVCELGEIQAISYHPPKTAAPAFGVQFHPESHLSEHADVLRANWLDACGI